MIKINEAIEHAEKNGISIDVKDLAVQIWPDANFNTALVSMYKLLRGQSKTIRPEWIKVICNETGVDANFLFDINPKNQ